MRGRTIIIQGGQYGSEGKGQIAAVIAQREKVVAAVRTGSINAGHTVYRDGKKFVMQIIPTAWIHPGIDLVLGAGCYIHPDILAKEVRMIAEATGEDIRERLIIDNRCTWFDDVEAKKSAAAGRHHAMGATGKGNSEAIKSKMDARGDEYPQSILFKDYARVTGLSYKFTDTVEYLDAFLDLGRDILLEGTQGALLDFNTGPYPFVTSRMTNAAAWLAEAGLPPVNVHTILVVRSHPIRVAGNSGPMPDEISWPILTREVNLKLDRVGQSAVVPEFTIQDYEMALDLVTRHKYPEVVEYFANKGHAGWATQHHLWTDEERYNFRITLSEAPADVMSNFSPSRVEELKKFFEMTTVTKKIRRVARLNVAAVVSAIKMNAPAEIAYTFLNYDFPHIRTATSPYDLNMDKAVFDHIASLETQFGVKIRYASTGPLNEHVVDLHA